MPSWADLAFSKPRYIPTISRLTASTIIADAPNFIYSAGVLVDKLGRRSGSLLWRRLGTHHLNDGGSCPTDKRHSE